MTGASATVPEPAGQTIAGALDAFRRRELRPSQLVGETLTRIQSLDGDLNAFSQIFEEQALSAAETADADWEAGRERPLSGIPISVKDLVDIAGFVTGCGNPAAAPPEPATASASVVKRLEAAGAIIVGKTNLHEFALGITGENQHTGTPRNPHDRSHMPGGSSSGSGVSVASGMALASIGTDTGGSVRVPAGLCGVVGFKPTFGRISRAGVFPLSWTMDHVGPLAATVDDAALLYRLLKGEDHQDPATIALPDPPSRRVLRVGLLSELTEIAGAAVRERLQTALRALPAVESVTLPYTDSIAATYSAILVAEGATVHHRQLRDNPEVFGDDVRTLLSVGATLFAPDYVQAMRVRAAFAAECEALFEQFDCLAAPTTLSPAPEIGARSVDIDGRRVSVRDALVTCTRPFSMIGLPAISLPCGTQDGLPVGLQIIGPRYGDELVLEAAKAIETALSASP
ncbi:MAG: hypothetical protein GEU28_01560 [Dehalococcoidia bacterium]|nr:hypothetical protein [Dehalococcoidia bacterium]